MASLQYYIIIRIVTWLRADYSLDIFFCLIVYHIWWIKMNIAKFSLKEKNKIAIKEI